VKRGWYSLVVLSCLYVVSLGAEFVANDRPLWLKFDGRIYWPVFVSYSQNDFLGDGNGVKITDYKTFLAGQTNAVVRKVMAPFESGKHQTFSAADIEPFLRYEVEFVPDVAVAAYQVDGEGNVLWSYGDVDELGLPEGLFENAGFAEAVGRRLANKRSEAFEMVTEGGVIVRLAPFAPRMEAPGSVRVFVRTGNEQKAWRKWVGRDDNLVIPGGKVNVRLEQPAFPFRPVPGHPMGFDGSGRDVLARILYGLRIAMTFGLILVSATLFIGTCAGAVQGYFTGWTDIAGQRFTEIWAHLPFLYVIILLGNTFGRSFGLLLACYAVFNWIGAASYTRAEFLRLRTKSFVDAAKCQGLSGARIMFAHILPNALTPVITLLPFALVGSISALSGLDYLGYGLPAGTPSWGELLGQAQMYRSAWWLILYPSLALFTVMLLGVFVGEALRAAADPRPYSKME